MPKWFQADVARFEDERARMEQRGFVVDEAAREQRQRIEFTGVINDGVSDVAIRVICADGFPYRIPLFLAPELRLTPATRHIAFRTHMICLRTAKPQGWDHNERIVDLIPDAERILRAQHTGDFGEEHLAPDQDLFGTRAAKKHVILPDDLLVPPDDSSFEVVASMRFNGCAMLVHKVGVRQTNSNFAIFPEQERCSVFRLREMPLDTIAECNDLIGQPSPNWQRMLEKYAVNPALAATIVNELGRSSLGGYFGIVFPFLDNWSWQFFRVDRISKKRMSIERLGTGMLSALGTRLAGVLDLHRLRERTVLVAGCGGIGGTVAVELACAGVGKLFLNDFDVISIANVIRHECSLANLGHQKTIATKWKIGLKNPLVSVVTGPDIFSDPDFENKVTRSDLVVCAIGDYNTEEYVNSVCVRHNKPTVFAYIGVYGAMGHVMRMDTRAHETGCFACFRRYLEAGEIPDLPIVADVNAAVVEMGCNNPSLPAASFDQRTVALMAVRKAIQALDPWTYNDDVADAIVFYARHMDGVVDEQSLKTRKFKVLALPDCPICGIAVRR